MTGATPRPPIIVMPSKPPTPQEIQAAADQVGTLSALGSDAIGAAASRTVIRRAIAPKAPACTNPRHANLGEHRHPGDALPG